ncbi:MAG: DNA repair protein RecO [Candidatus Pacebacteria bacterium]|nr:DNA repair protein RecO [Candidatus Paceibacterota bacterium]
MFVHYRTTGFVFKKLDQSEADQVFTIFTKDFGVLKILAKGIRKSASKLKSGIPIFCISEIEFIQGKTHKILTDAILINNFENIKKDLIKLRVAYKISETLDQLIKPPQKDEKIWNLLNEVFKNLNNDFLLVTHYSLLYFYFLLNLLSILGYHPELYECLICRNKLKPQNLYFSFKGGIMCSSCKVKSKEHLVLNIDQNIVKILRESFKRNISDFLKIRIKKQHQVSINQISEFCLSHKIL